MSDQLPVTSNPWYPSGAASLFAAMAREDAGMPAESQAVTITCAWCLSDDTEMVDHEHDIYQCRNCGETFIRSSG